MYKKLIEEKWRHTLINETDNVVVQRINYSDIFLQATKYECIGNIFEHFSYNQRVPHKNAKFIYFRWPVEKIETEFEKWEA